MIFGLLCVYSQAWSLGASIIQSEKMPTWAKVTLGATTAAVYVPAAVEGGVAGYYWAMANPVEAMAGIDIVYGAASPEPPMNAPQLIGNRIKAWVINPILGNK
jgi:hypothetical protein